MTQRHERLLQFISDRPPEPGQVVEILCEDHVGTYTLPFLCHRTEAGWISAATAQPIEADVLGWRPASEQAQRRHDQRAARFS